MVAIHFVYHLHRQPSPTGNFRSFRPKTPISRYADLLILDCADVI